MSGVTARYVRVGKVSEVPQDGAEVFDVEDRKIAVYRLEDGFYAIDDICTHDGGPLDQGELEGFNIECPRHGAKFDIRSGRVTALPAIRPVGTYTVKVENGDVLVDVES